MVLQTRNTKFRKGEVVFKVYDSPLYGKKLEVRQKLFGKAKDLNVLHSNKHFRVPARTKNIQGFRNGQEHTGWLQLVES